MNNENFRLNKELGEFVDSSVEFYSCLTDGDRVRATELFFDIVFQEYIVSRLSGLIDEKVLRGLCENQGALYKYAATYMRKAPIDFDEGHKVELDWSIDAGLE